MAKWQLTRSTENIGLGARFANHVPAQEFMKKKSTHFVVNLGLEDTVRNRIPRYGTPKMMKAADSSFISRPSVLESSGNLPNTVTMRPATNGGWFEATTRTESSIFALDTVLDTVGVTGGALTASIIVPVSATSELGLALRSRLWLFSNFVGHLSYNLLRRRPDLRCAQ